jgi:tetratricopeptide (TPR) repeat protein
MEVGAVVRLALKWGAGVAIWTFLGGLALAQEKQPEWKDRAEYDLYDSIVKEQSPASRLEKLDKWLKDYPDSQFAKNRRLILLGTYQQLNRPKDVINTGKEVMKDDPLQLQALSAMAVAVYQIVPPEPQYLTDAQMVLNTILDNLDKLYAPDKKPQGVADDAWAKGKVEMQNFAQRTLGWTYMQQKDNAKAEEAFTKALATDPNNAQVSAWLGTVMIAQRQAAPEKIPVALFHFARAGYHEGAGALDAAARKSYQDYFHRVHKQYTGDGKDAEQVVTWAKAGALPPGDFKIKSQLDKIKEELGNKEKLKAENPMQYLWQEMKAELTGENGQSYFENSMKDALLPGGAEGVKLFRGKLVSTNPEVNPKTLVISIGGAENGDATLLLDAPLRGKMEPGADISFEGTAKSFSKAPFMVTFEVEKGKVTGWAGGGGAVAPPAKKAPAPAPAKKAGVPAAPAKKG